MEHSSSSERVATVRRDNDRGPVCDGVGVDGEWERQRVCEGTSPCESTEACMSPIRSPRLILTIIQSL